MIDVSGKVCLVTGASRGIGRGVALQLVTHGATCYITGRSLESLKLVEDEVKARDLTGKLIAVKCDHSCDKNVEMLFKRIATEQNNQLDLLVNNAYAAVDFLTKHQDICFWDQSCAESWDIVNNVGLRNHYICAVFAARLMVPCRKGLIINIGSLGGKSAFGYPSYQIGKGAVDRMAMDCGYELAKYNVAFVSLWPGLVKTEHIKQDYYEIMLKSALTDQNILLKRYFEVGETPEYTGKAVVHILNDKNIMRRTRKIELTTDIGCEFNFNDVNGSTPANQRSIRLFLHLAGASRLASLFPNWLRIPKSIFFWLLGFANPADKLPSKYE